MNLFSLHCRGVNSINDEVKYTQKPRAMQMFAKVPHNRFRSQRGTFQKHYHLINTNLAKQSFPSHEICIFAQ